MCSRAFSCHALSATAAKAAAAGWTLVSQGTDWALLNASEETSVRIELHRWVCLKLWRFWKCMRHSAPGTRQLPCLFHGSLLFFLLKRIWTIARTARRAATCFCPPRISAHEIKFDLPTNYLAYNILQQPSAFSLAIIELRLKSSGHIPPRTIRICTN